MSDDLQGRLQAEKIELSPISKRFFAAALDEILIAIVFLFVIYDQLQGLSDPDDIVALVNSFTLEYMFIKILYQTGFVAQYGATIGKIALKIRVINQDDFEKPGFASALNRSIFRIISESVFWLGYIWAFYTHNRETWHDKTAKTLVVNA